jgi:hypothetical protein
MKEASFISALMGSFNHLEETLMPPTARYFHAEKSVLV